MNVLFVTGRYTCQRDIVGEDFGYVMRLSQGLADLGHQVRVLTADYRKKEALEREIKGVKYVSEPFSPVTAHRFYHKVKSLTKSSDVTVSTKSPLWGLMCVKVSKKHNTPCMYHVNDSWRTPNPFIATAYQKMMSYICANADAVTCVSEALAKDVEKMGAKKIYHLPNGVDLNLFKPTPKADARKKLNLPDDKKIITYTGSIDSNRGIDTLLAAHKTVRKEHPETMLCLYGKGSEKPESEYVSTKDLPQSLIPYALCAADVAVLPNSDNDFARNCFPYKLLEYMACDVPFVATKVGSSEDILEGKGHMCRPDDPHDMAEKIMQAMSPQTRGLREKALKYSWTERSKDLECILSEISGTHPRK